MREIVQFIYTHLGAEYEVEAEFERKFNTPSFDGPEDDEWQVYEIRAFCPDGNDWFGEFKDIYERKFAKLPVEYVSIADRIEAAAREKL